MRCTGFRSRIDLPAIVFLLLVAGFFLAPVRAPGAPRPAGHRLLLVPVEGEKTLASAVTRALKADLRQGQKLEVTEFRPDLPTLKRAVLEKRLTSSDLDSTDPKSRLRIASALEMDYILFGKVSGGSGNIHLTFSALEASSGRQYDFEATMSTAPGIGQDTLVLSAANTVVAKFMQQVLGISPPAEPAIVPGGLGLPREPASGTTPGANPGTEGSAASGGAASPPASSGQSPPANSQDAGTPANPLPVDPVNLPAQPGPEASAYASQAESLAASGDLAGAIQAMRSAVNLSPDEVDLRLKLADYYKRKGMDDEAAAETKRAMELSPTETGARHQLAAQLQASGSDDDAEKVLRGLLKTNPKDITARLALGDALWNQGKVDDAALEYAQAASDAPDDPAPQESLARLFASRGKFREATSSLATSKVLRNEQDDYPVEAGLYRSLIQSADVAYRKAVSALDASGAAFRKGELTHEEYYNKVRALETDVELLTDFLTDLDPPAAYSKPHLHRTLAASLLAQAVTATEDWVLKDKQALKDQAEQFQHASQMEMDTAAQLEGGLRQ